MRILFVCGGGLVGGKERQTIEYMIEMRRLGHEVFCIASSWSSPEFETTLRDNQIPFEKMRIGFIAMTFTLSAIRMTLHQAIYVPSLWMKYRRLIKSWAPSVVVHTNFHHVILLLPLLQSPKQIFHIHDIFSVSGKFKRLFRMFNRKIDKFIGVSNYVCRNLEALNVPKEKIELIYNGVRFLDEAVDTSNDVPVVGIVGQIGKWKGHSILIEALGSLKNIPWMLHIIGGGDEAYISDLKAKVAEEDLSSRIIFVGKRSGLDQIYRGLDIVCVPSLWDEPFGLVAAEPGFFGIPTIVTDRGGLPEIVVDNETGQIVPAGDVQKLSTALRVLLTDPEKRRQMGSAAQVRVRKLFSIEVSGLHFDKLLNDLSKI